MNPRPLLPAWLLRAACLVAALANLLAAAALALWPAPLLRLAGATANPRSLLLETALAATVGLAALAAWLRPEAPAAALVAAAGGGLRATASLLASGSGAAGAAALPLAAADGLLALALLLHAAQRTAPDLAELGHSLLDGLDVRPGSRRALLLGFSLTGNGARALEAVKEGLSLRGYAVEIAMVVPREELFARPPSGWAQGRIALRALLRTPAPIAPVAVAGPEDWDLVVVESPTWMLGVAAPVEALFRGPEAERLFRGRDAVAIGLAQGSARRTVAMLVRLLEEAGANPVAAREVLAPRGLPAAALASLRNLGSDLAGRSRTRKHWTMLLDLPAPGRSEVARG